MPERWVWLVVLAVAMLGLALGTLFAPPRPAVELLHSPKPRNVTPEVSVAERRQLAAGNTSFALALYRRLRQSEGNLVLSPYSISLAMAMVYAGATGETAREMATTLRFPLPQSRLHPAFNALDLDLGRRAESAGLELKIANAIWGQRGYAFKQAYLDLLALNYGAGLRGLDFQRDPEGSRKIINAWVSEETKGKIEELFPPDSVRPNTTLVLANAVYFRGTWEEKFSPAGRGIFHLLDGAKIEVQMMRRTGRTGYMAGDGYRAVEIRYKGGAFSMVVVLPDSGRFGEFEAKFGPELLEEVVAKLRETEVDLTMPTFSFSYGFDLRESLTELGMVRAFSGGADFSGIAEGGLFISAAVHKAFIRVDEEGTEAAAATGVVVGRALVTEVTVDRPFVFFIRDRETGTILFLGRVTDPSP